MKKPRGKRHMSEKIIRKLREADTMLAAGKTIGQVVQALEISEQTLHRWLKQYGGMKAEEAKRLKKLLAEAELDKSIMKEALEGNLWCKEHSKKNDNISAMHQLSRHHTHQESRRGDGEPSSTSKRRRASREVRNVISRGKRRLRRSGSCGGSMNWFANIHAMDIGSSRRYFGKKVGV
jgi:putative transposase